MGHGHLVLVRAVVPIGFAAAGAQEGRRRMRREGLLLLGPRRVRGRAVARWGDGPELQ